MKHKEKVLAIYDQDPDGFGSAWAVWKRYGWSADYVEVLHGSPLPQLDYDEYDHIYILDLTFTFEELVKNVPLGRTEIIDHHPSAIDLLEALSMPIDTTRAACVQTWERLHGTDAPPILQYVADRDTWTWALPRSDEINSYIFSCDQTFEEWDDINAQLAWDPIDVIFAGDAIVKYRRKLVEQICENAVEVDYGHGLVPTVCAPVLHSEVGHKLLQDYPETPYSMTYVDIGDKRKFSMRSEEGRMDVGEVAVKMGGGGHRNAAGFYMTHDEIWEEARGYYAQQA